MCFLFKTTTQVEMFHFLSHSPPFPQKQNREHNIHKRKISSDLLVGAALTGQILKANQSNSLQKWRRERNCWFSWSRFGILWRKCWLFEGEQTRKFDEQLRKFLWFVPNDYKKPKCKNSYCRHLR